MTIGEVFSQTVRKFPKKEALVDIAKGRRYTYEQWEKEVNRLANALLEAGVQKGDRVSTVLFNTLELGTAFFACVKIGAIFNPINFRLKRENSKIFAPRTNEKRDKKLKERMKSRNLCKKRSGINRLYFPETCVH